MNLGCCVAANVDLFSVYLFLPRLIHWRRFETVCVDYFQWIAQDGQGPGRGKGRQTSRAPREILQESHPQGTRRRWWWRIRSQRTTACGASESRGESGCHALVLHCANVDTVWQLWHLRIVYGNSDSCEANTADNILFVPLLANCDTCGYFMATVTLAGTLWQLWHLRVLYGNCDICGYFMATVTLVGQILQSIDCLWHLRHTDYWIEGEWT